MGKLVLFMHVSLDGYTARPGGEIDWIRIDEEMFEHSRIRTEEADLALYGRKTFEIMEAYWPTAADGPNPSKHDIQHSTWYKQIQKVVVSSTLSQPSNDKLKVIGSDILNRIEGLKKQVSREIIMFGSPGLGGTLLKENQIDDLWLFVNPILLGNGISLFQKNSHEIKLALVESIPFASGVVCLHYSKI